MKRWDEHSIKETAAKLEVSAFTVWRWCRSGRLQHRRDSAGRYWIADLTIHEILENPILWRERNSGY